MPHGTNNNKISRVTTFHKLPIQARKRKPQNIQRNLEKNEYYLEVNKGEKVIIFRETNYSKE